MKKLFLLAVLFVMPCVVLAGGEIPQAKRQEIEKMLRLTGTEQLMVQMKTQMLDSLKADITEVPGSFWVRFEQKLDMGELLQKLIPLYDKYYSMDDLKAVNAFYESPAGQKILATLPQLMQESMVIGQEWGRTIGEQAAAEAEREMKASKRSAKK